MEKFKECLLRWLRGPAMIIDGLVITVTLGMVNPSLSLKAEAAYLDACEANAYRG